MSRLSWSIGRSPSNPAISASRSPLSPTVPRSRRVAAIRTRRSIGARWSRPGVPVEPGVLATLNHLPAGGYNERRSGSGEADRLHQLLLDLRGCPGDLDPL